VNVLLLLFGFGDAWEKEGLGGRDGKSSKGEKWDPFTRTCSAKEGHSSSTVRPDLRRSFSSAPAHISETIAYLEISLAHVLMLLDIQPEIKSILR